MGSNTLYYLVGGIVIAVVVGFLVLSTSQSGGGGAPVVIRQSSSSSKPVILYVNQGNGVVNESNFGKLLDTATSHGFNTIFFQVYRSGTLLFSGSSLAQFAVSAHDQGLKIFFALYFTNTTQAIPTSIYSDGEDGISLDMSTLPMATQTTLFDDLTSAYSGKTAITTTDLTGYPLHPDYLVVETYAPGDQQYMHSGMIGGVEVVATSSKANYEQQVQYALANSDGVMVFDYAGLVKSGY